MPQYCQALHATSRSSASVLGGIPLEERCMHQVKWYHPFMKHIGKVYRYDPLISGIPTAPLAQDRACRVLVRNRIADSQLNRSQLSETHAQGATRTHRGRAAVPPVLRSEPPRVPASANQSVHLRRLALVHARAHDPPGRDFHLSRRSESPAHHAVTLSGSAAASGLRRTRAGSGRPVCTELRPPRGGPARAGPREYPAALTR